jgi:hypothetical protein
MGKGVTEGRKGAGKWQAEVDTLKSCLSSLGELDHNEQTIIHLFN